ARRLRSYMIWRLPCVGGLFAGLLDAAFAADGLLFGGGAFVGVVVEDFEGLDGVWGEEVGADFFGEAFGAVEDAAGADDLHFGGDADVVEEVDELADHGGGGRDGAVDHED